MNNYAVQGRSVMANEYTTGPMQIPGKGAITAVIQELHKEIVELSEQIGALGEQLSPVLTEGSSVTGVGSNAEEKRPPASRHAESLRELQQIVRSCRTRINVISSQLDI